MKKRLDKFELVMPFTPSPQEELSRRYLMQEPPRGAVRKVATNVDDFRNEIIVWPNKGLTIVGTQAWTLYTWLRTVHFKTPLAKLHGATVSLGSRSYTVSVKDMTYLLRFSGSCKDVVPRIRQAVEVECAMSGTEVDWEYTSGPVAVRLSADLDGEPPAPGTMNAQHFL